jgi:hypothetical protein
VSAVRPCIERENPPECRPTPLLESRAFTSNGIDRRSAWNVVPS